MKTTRFLYTNFNASGAHQSAKPLASELSTSTPETSSGTPNSSGTSSTNATSVLKRVHTKSRRGCLNCKRRRIKVSTSHSKKEDKYVELRGTTPLTGYSTVS